MLGAGGLHTAAFAPVEAWWLQILAVAALAWAVRPARPGRAALLGWCFSLGWLVSGLWWLYISMHDFGGMPAPLAGLAVVLLCAALSLYSAGAMALCAALRRSGPVAFGLAFSGCWLLAELARGQWLTGFPWIASGYAHTTGPLAGLAPWLGVYGIGAVAALCAATLAEVGAWAVAHRRGPSVPAAAAVAANVPPTAAATAPSIPAAVPVKAARPVSLAALAAGALALPLLAALAPSDFTVPTGSLSVSLLQPNVAQDLKFDPERMAANMAALEQRLHAARGQLVVTPESVVPLTQDQLDPAYWQRLTQPFRQGGQAALLGIFLGNEQAGYVNSLVGVAPGLAPGAEYTYGKRHLLPFGEFIPPGFRWFVDLMNIPLGDQARGTRTDAFEVAGQRLRPLICYEDLFGEDFAASMVGPQAATVLVNASNLAWFGPWMMQDQHLQFSRMRALEFQRPVVRSTNTGATAVVDHQGQVTARLPPLVAGTLDAGVEGRSGDTPYARWVAAFGLWPAWACAFLITAISLLLGRKR